MSWQVINAQDSDQLGAKLDAATARQLHQQKSRPRSGAVASVMFDIKLSPAADATNLAKD